MTSLYPGLLFYSTGLNKKSTPNKPEATPSEIDRKLGRGAFNGRPWPKSSPISAVYDVCNSSTRMIILNNKLSRKPKGSRLRGQSDYQGDICQPEPDRHATESSSHTNWEHHKQCSLSVSEKFVPLFPSGVAPIPEWVNKTQRPPMKFDNGSGVNPNHHIQCQGHMDYDIIRWYNAHRRPRSRTSTRGQGRTLSPVVNDPSLSQGEKLYLSSIAKIYSVEDMRHQKQIQYNQLMWKEIGKGTYKVRDWEKYNRYLNTPRKTQFGPCDPFRQTRSISAPGQARKKDGEESRPHTIHTEPRPVKNSRGSTISGAGNRPRERRNLGRAAANQQGSQRRQSKQGGGQKMPTDLTGKPARAESPLILKEKKSPASSLSSLADERQGESDAKKDTDKQGSPKEAERKDKMEESKSYDSPAKDEKSKEIINAEDGDESKQRADVKITVDEVEDRRMSDEDDERSKMSARDSGRSNEQRGVAVEYRPTTHGDRSGEGERSLDDDMGEPSKESKQETYKYTNTMEAEQHRKDEREQGDNTSSSPKPKEATHGVSEEKDTNTSESVKPVETKAGADKKDGSFADDGPELIHHIHKEGKDRPLSRLGGREQFMVVKQEPERENSDDDYSDDEEESNRNKERADDAAEQARGDHSVQHQAQSEDTSAEVQEASTGLAPSTNQDGQSEDPDNQTSKLSSQRDDYSEISSRAVVGSNVGSSVQNKAQNLEPATPTEASSQEKPSDISTIEY